MAWLLPNELEGRKGTTEDCIRGDLYTLESPTLEAGVQPRGSSSFPESVAPPSLQHSREGEGNEERGWNTASWESQGAGGEVGRACISHGHVTK